VASLPFGGSPCGQSQMGLVPHPGSRHGGAEFGEEGKTTLKPSQPRMVDRGDHRLEHGLFIETVINSHKGQGHNSPCIFPALSCPLLGTGGISVTCLMALTLASGCRACSLPEQLITAELWGLQEQGQTLNKH
jgi:hypothetical protein